MLPANTPDNSVVIAATLIHIQFLSDANLLPSRYVPTVSM
jgi:hypothetical protein